MEIELDLSRQVENDIPDLHISFSNNQLLIDLYGAFDGNLTQLEQALSVQFIRRGNEIFISGSFQAQKTAYYILNFLYLRLKDGKLIDPNYISGLLNMLNTESIDNFQNERMFEIFKENNIEIKTRKKSVEPRTIAQQEFVKNLFTKELAFGLGPAGTGKTYLAVAVGISMLIDGLVDKIILSRPAIEAGERLGFLPGDIKDKIDPYMLPLYDALSDFLPDKQLEKMIEEKKIEIAPLAFMRGRTLSNAFVVLDEAQNATALQMKMFLTRFGEGSRMAITGDVSQIDLPRGVKSGLVEAKDILCDIEGIGFTYFKAEDIVRHSMVAKIVKAYSENSSRNA